MMEGDLNTSMNSSSYSSDSLENLVVSLEFPAFKDQIQRSFDHNLKILTKMLEEKGENLYHKGRLQKDSNYLLIVLLLILVG